MPHRLLLADDSLTIQKVVELTFPDPEYEMLAVGNGDKAMEALESFRPDVVLADVVMPGPPGYDICEAVRKRPGGAHTPVVLLTGTFEPFDRARADRVGATAVVTKPFDSHALSALVRDLLRKSAEQRAAAESAPAPEARGPFAPLDVTPAEEKAAADLFGEEPAAKAEPPEEDLLYATSAIPIASVSPAFAPPPPPAPEPPVIPPPPPPPTAMEPFAPPPQAHAAAAAGDEEIPFAPLDEEPLPPPPPFETAPSAPLAAWELADEPTAIAWDVPPAAEPMPRMPAATEQESTQPLVSGAPMPEATEAMEAVEEAEVSEASDATEAFDVHGASTPTAVIHAPREPEPMPEPPLYMQEPEPPPPPSPVTTAAIPTMEFRSEAPPRLLPEEAALPEEQALPPAPEEARASEDVFALGTEETEQAESAPEPPVLEAAPQPGQPSEELEEEPVEEPVARDIDEDIAAYESIAAAEPAAAEPELEALAAGASLTDLIPPAPQAAAPSAPAAAGRLADEDVERIARRVAELVGDKVLRDVAWEVVPELAERLVRQRLAEIERE